MIGLTVGNVKLVGLAETKDYIKYYRLRISAFRTVTSIFYGLGR